MKMTHNQILNLVTAYRECRKKEDQIKSIFCGNNDCDFLQGIQSEIYKALTSGATADKEDKIFDALWEDNGNVSATLKIEEIYER